MFYTWFLATAYWQVSTRQKSIKRYTYWNSHLYWIYWNCNTHCISIFRILHTISACNICFRQGLFILVRWWLVNLLNLYNLVNTIKQLMLCILPLRSSLLWCNIILTSYIYITFLFSEHRILSRLHSRGGLYCWNQQRIYFWHGNSI